MNNGLRNIGAGTSLCIFFILQLVAGSVAPGIFFFPIVALYAASYMTSLFALVSGGVLGILWDSMSGLPFGTHTVLFLSSLGVVGYVMQFANERSLGARSVVVVLSGVGYAVLVGALYFFLGGGARALLLHGYDMGIGFLILGVIIGSHAVILRYFE